MERVNLNSLPPDFLTDPYPYYSRLREEDPVHVTSRGIWILTRYDEVASVLRDPRFGRQGFRDLLRSGLPDSQDTVATSMQFQDPPGHTRLRCLIGKAFTLNLVQNLRPHIQQIVDELLDRVRDAHTIDLISDFAFPLPVNVITELLGVTIADRALFHHWSLDLARDMDNQSVAPAFEHTAEIHRAIANYFRGAIAERRQHPRDDFLTKLMATEENGSRLTEFELLDICGLLFIAGHQTTVNLIGNGILALLLHPSDLRALRDEPGLLSSAVEEMLRYDSPVQRVARMARANVEIGGKTIPKGAVVLALLGAANRDPVRFTEPDRLDVTRRDNRHLAFGSGDRFCLGAALARLEGQIAINTLLRRLPSLELTNRPRVWRLSTETRGLMELPVVF
jgi:cytochrome P450